MSLGALALKTTIRIDAVATATQARITRTFVYVCHKSVRKNISFNIRVLVVMPLVQCLETGGLHTVVSCSHRRNPKCLFFYRIKRQRKRERRLNGVAQQNSLVDGTEIQHDNLTSVNNSSLTTTNIIAVDSVPLSADCAMTTSAA